MFTSTSLAACTVAALCGGPVATPESSLTLTLSHLEGETTSVRLVCHPAQGSHPQADSACRSLERAGGDFTRLPRKEQLCTMVYAPVHAEARGQWRGEPVRFSTEYSNACFADAESGGVFAF